MQTADGDVVRQAEFEAWWFEHQDEEMARMHEIMQRALRRVFGEEQP